MNVEYRGGNGGSGQVQVKSSAVLSAADHRSAGTASRIAGIILTPLGIIGTAVFGIHYFGTPLGIPDNALWMGIFPVLFLALGPLQIYWSALHYRRAASMARIEAGGTAAWGRFEKMRNANWSHGPKVGGSVYYFHFTVHPQQGAPHATVAEDRLPKGVYNIMVASPVPLLLDPEDPILAAVQWEAMF